MLSKLGFSPKWISRAMVIVKSVSYSRTRLESMGSCLSLLCRREVSGKGPSVSFFFAPHGNWTKRGWHYAPTLAIKAHPFGTLSLLICLSCAQNGLVYLFPDWVIANWSKVLKSVVWRHLALTFCTLMTMSSSSNLLRMQLDTSWLCWWLMNPYQVRRLILTNLSFSLAGSAVKGCFKQCRVFSMSLWVVVILNMWDFLYYYNEQSRPVVKALLTR